MKQMSGQDRQWPDDGEMLRRVQAGIGPVSGHSGTPGDDWTVDDLARLMAWGSPIMAEAERMLAEHQRQERERGK